jgi:hypothetical protein
MAAKPSLKNLLGMLQKTRREIDMSLRRLDVVTADLLEYIAQEGTGSDVEKSRQTKKQKRRP